MGISPHKLSVAIVLGFAIGICPLYGFTTFLCVVFAFSFRLNMAAIQLVNYLFWPLQISLIPVFVRFGEKLFHSSKKFPFSPREIKLMFENDWIEALRNFGLSLFHGVLSWLIFIIPFSIILYFILLPFLKGVKRKILEIKANNSQNS